MTDAPARPRAKRPFRLQAESRHETEIHLEALRAVRAALSHTGALVLHYPAGGGRDPASRQLMKILGVRSGVPDLLVLLWGRIWTLEIKAADGVESPAQRTMAAELAAAGVPRAVVRSGREAVRQLRAWGLPVRRIWTVEPELPPPLDLPEGFEALRAALGERVRALRLAWVEALRLRPPEQWADTERMQLEQELHGLQRVSLEEPAAPASAS